MTTRATILVFTAALAVGPLAAQQGINLRLAQGQPARYTPPLCPLKAINSKVKKCEEVLRKAFDAKVPAERAALITDARQNLVTAITQEAQAGNAAAWYYLGRVALLRGDPAEVDSAFTKAQELVPSCEIDITQYRQNNWAMLANTGIEFQKKNETDSALALFRDASLLFRGLPHVYANMGVVYANAAKDDSAAVYFAKSLEIAEKDTTLIEDRNSAALNLSIMYQRLGKHPEAIKLLHKYLGWKPGDTDAQRSLAAAFRSAGMTDSATAIELGMVAQFSKSNLDSLETQDLIAVGVSAFNAQRYPEAEAAFAKAVKRNAWSRDARYNLANAYFAMARQAHEKADTLRKAKVVDSAAAYDAIGARHDSALVRETSKLLEMEPMNEDALRLLAAGQRALKQEAAVIKTAEKLVALPFTIDVNSFHMGQSVARLAADAVGRTPQDPTGKTLKAAPVAIVIEFVDAGGAVVDTKEVTIPVVASGAKHAFQVEAKGTGIMGWKYRPK
jgi:tetratricopeptide (TPR) repeat protein